MSEAICGLLRSSSSRHQPWQLAAALAMGISCGMLPKFSVMFCLVAGGCVLLPIHLPLAALACATSSLVSLAATPLTGCIGTWSLTHPWFSSFWLTLDTYPLVPWLGLHNSVTNGGTLLGLAMWLPVFLIAQSIARRLPAPPADDDTGRTDPDFRHELKPLMAPIQQPANSQPIKQTRASFHATTTLGDHQSADHSRAEIAGRQQHRAGIADPCDQLQQLLEQCHSEDGNQLSVQQVVTRAARIAEFVDELLTSCAAEESTPLANAAAEPEHGGASDGISPDTALDAIDISSELAYCTPDSQEKSFMRPAPALPLVSKRPPTATSQRSTEELGERQVDFVKRHHQHGELPDAIPQQVEAAGYPVHGIGRQQEALRYLLHHLKAFRDKV